MENCTFAVTKIVDGDLHIKYDNRIYPFPAEADVLLAIKEIERGVSGWWSIDAYKEAGYEEF